MQIIKLRRDVSFDWTAKNSVLREGEPGVELDTGRFKIGDGFTPWLDLPYFTPGPGGPPGEVTDEMILEHVNAALPHPIYDDGPSLTLLYENAKV